MVNQLELKNSLLNEFISEIRDVTIQKDSLRFRNNLERIGEIFAYEISKTLDYKNTQTTTPLGIAQTKNLVSQPVIASILRAGLPLHHGILNYFDKAENAFISAYRKHTSDKTFEIAVESISCPNITEKTVIICDPMLASGSSMLASYKELLKIGTPKHIHVVIVIACESGLDFLKKNIEASNYTIWCAAIDKKLSDKSYILPGLGDAGDLAFGEKI